MKKSIIFLSFILLFLSVFGSSLTVRIPQNIDFLDPHKAAASGTDEVMFNVFEGLLKPDSQGNLNPAVAENYTISQDGLTFKFFIRKNIKFHDGSYVTPDDVKYSLERLSGLDGGPGYNSAMISTIKSVTADKNDNSVTVILKTADTNFLSNFTKAIIPRHNDQYQNSKPIGTGPFKFISYQPDQNILLEKFKDYWKTGYPKVDKVEFKIISDEQAALLSFMAGNIDIYPRIPAQMLDILGNNIKIISGGQNLVQLMAMNNARKPFDDIRVRQAVNYALNKDEIIELAALGYGTKLGSNMSPVMAKYYQEGLENYYSTNTEKAKELLKEAGYPKGFSTTITVPSVYQFHVDTAQIIVEQLKKVGINAKIELVEWGVWLDRVYAGRDYDTTIIGFTGKLSAYDVLKRYESGYSRNFMNYKSEVFDNMFKKAYAEIDDKISTDLYKELQVILTEDAPAVFIMDPNFIIAMDENIDGYEIYPYYVQDMSTVYFK